MHRCALASTFAIGAGLCIIGGSAVADDKEEFLGIHTCVPNLCKKPFAGIFLHGNYKLPPYVIATGNGERVRDALKYLDEGVLLRDVMRALHLNPYRIEIAVGLYKGTPVMVFEHQMGGGSTEIYLKELLSTECMTNIYKVGSQCFTADSKYLIRLGTSLGINDSIDNAQSARLSPGDIAVSSHQVGISSTDFQAITSNLNIFNAEATVQRAGELLTKMGYEMREIGGSVKETWPVVQFDEEVHDILSECI